MCVLLGPAVVHKLHKYRDSTVVEFGFSVFHRTSQASGTALDGPTRRDVHTRGALGDVRQRGARRTSMRDDDRYYDCSHRTVPGNEWSELAYHNEGGLADRGSVPK